MKRADHAIDQAKGIIADVRGKIAEAQRHKALILKRMTALSRRGGRAYTKQLHAMDDAMLQLKMLQEDRLTAKYILDTARLSRLRCQQALNKINDRP